MTSNIGPTTPTTSKKMNVFVAHLLHRIKKESAEEYVEIQEAFELMGWAKLPDEIKIEIYEDVRFMIKELKGLFSTCDLYVLKRRETVHFWVQSYLDNIASKEVAVKALKIHGI